MSASWGDLRARVVSGAAISAVGLWTLWVGGAPFLALVALVCGLMVWELSRMVAPTRKSEALQLGILGAGAIVLAGVLPGWPVLPILLAPAIVASGLLKAHQIRVVIYTVAILGAGYGFLLVREGTGGSWTLWLVLVVIVTDVAGYFAGRSLGGPKFWPRISPKKTWSGTVAGWLSATIVGLIFVALTDLPALALVLSPALSFGSQLGDIAESALKRKMGVKDSSALIPGHGGVMDRFDGMMGASLSFWVMALLGFVPAGGL